jgi:hypothetical protein
MATDARARAALVIGAGWLALLAWQCIKLARVVGHDGAALRAVGARTLFDRASQLKPWLFKAPLSFVWLGAFLAALGAALLMMWLVALRRAVSRQPSA